MNSSCSSRGNSSERLNLLVTRLRKKAAEALAEPLPLKTAHQLGYAFTAAARLLQDHNSIPERH